MAQEDIDRVLFRPTRHDKTAAPEGACNIDIPLADGTVLGARLFIHAPASPTLIFFHGNSETVPDYDVIGPHYTAEGVNFLVLDYRGFGWSSGTATLPSFLPDARTAFGFLRDWLNQNSYTGPLALMGRSLGSACAIDVAFSHSGEFKALVLESAFAQALPLAQALGLDLETLGLSASEDPFDNVGKITCIGKPTLILHGQYDQLIGLWQAEKLHAESGAKTKELQVVPGADHNSLIEKGGRYYFSTIANFVTRVTGCAPSWRERRRAFKAAQKAEQAERAEQERQS